MSVHCTMSHHIDMVSHCMTARACQHSVTSHDLALHWCMTLGTSEKREARAGEAGVAKLEARGVTWREKEKGARDRPRHALGQHEKHPVTRRAP